MMKLVVLSCLLAAVSAGVLTPIAPIAYTSFLAPSNYRGPLSLAPGQPANILAADGRPLDTLEVNLDRSAHLTAKALDGLHILKKRSAPIFAAPAIAAPITYAKAPALAYTVPIATPIAAPIATSYGYGAGVHILKKRSAPLIAAPITYTKTLATPALAYSSPIAAPIATSYSYPLSYSAPLIHY
ncbi:unnamed protein product [Diatraea saccharalis]|uniref:Cuticle protein n=1 Tax=Diatraea saccharalis TaxID=40085 RepID=A0A9N9WGB3_9NEOP|nr:unnamed protein product [Diatraea saccharalis]